MSDAVFMWLIHRILYLKLIIYDNNQGELETKIDTFISIIFMFLLKSK